MRTFERFQYTLTLVAAFPLIFSPELFADEPGAVEERGAQQAHEDERRDERLPPVIPGETVSDGRKSIKVWSTAGKVAGGEAPRAECDARSDAKACSIERLGADVVIDGVTVDQRRRR